jgi:hypothetical protein
LPKKTFEPPGPKQPEVPPVNNNDMYTIRKTVFLFFLVIDLFINVSRNELLPQDYYTASGWTLYLPDQELLTDVEKSLVERGYMRTYYPLVKFGEELTCYHEKNGKVRIEMHKDLCVEIEAVSYFFTFLSKTEPNQTVVAEVLVNEEIHQYYKRNTTNEPALLWLKNENRYAWY